MYEAKTDELRQVRHTARLWNGDWYSFFTTEQKWEVQDGEPYEKPWGVSLDEPNEREIPRPPTVVVGDSSVAVSITAGSISITCPQRYMVRTKPQWRPLPVVEASDVPL